jgi:hypothetical protein
MVFRAKVNGDSPERTVFHGVTRNDQEQRNHVENQNSPDHRRGHLGDGAAGLGRSAAAMVVISAPVMAKNTVGTAASTPPSYSA